MKTIEARLHRLSFNQLRVLREIAKAPNGLLSSNESGDQVGIKGKSLGGVYSSLARQSFGEDTLIIPWGKSQSGRGLRWKLNETVISQKDLLEIVNRLLVYDN